LEDEVEEGLLLDWGGVLVSDLSKQGEKKKDNRHVKLTSHPIGLFLLLEISSISFQSRFATRALSLFITQLVSIHHARELSLIPWFLGRD